MPQMGSKSLCADLNSSESVGRKGQTSKSPKATQLIIAPVASENSIRLGAWLEWAPRMRAAHELLETAEFRGSPVPKVCATGMPIRRRPADADCPIELIE